MKLIVEPPFLITLAAFILLGDFKYLSIIFLSALIHEIGHITALHFFKVKIKALVLGFFGGSLILEKKLISYPAEITVALSGAFFNLIASGITFFILRRAFSEELFFFLLSNLSLFFFNLLPVRTLDGGGALISFLSLVKDPVFAEKTVSIISKLTLIILTFICVFILKASLFNVSLFALTVLLFAETEKGHVISGYPFCRSAS